MLLPLVLGPASPMAVSAASLAPAMGRSRAACRSAICSSTWRSCSGASPYLACACRCSSSFCCLPRLAEWQERESRGKNESGEILCAK